MGNFENIATNIIPISVKGIGTIGLIISFSCIFIGIYKAEIKNKAKKKKYQQNVLAYGLGGTFVYMGSLLIDYIMNFNPFSEAKIQFPLACVISIAVLAITCVFHKNKFK